MIVPGRSNRRTQHVGIIMHGLDGIHEEGQEHEVGLWSLARRKQIDTCVRCHAPVIVLSTSIDSCKWFFVKQYTQLMSTCNAIHDIHKQKIMIHCNTYLFKHRGTLKLCRSYFIVTCAEWNAEFVCFIFIISHKGIYSLGNRSEIMIFQ